VKGRERRKREGKERGRSRGPHFTFLATPLELIITDLEVFHALQIDTNLTAVDSQFKFILEAYLLFSNVEPSMQINNPFAVCCHVFIGLSLSFSSFHGILCL